MSILALGIVSWESEEDEERALDTGAHFITASWSYLVHPACGQPLWTHVETETSPVVRYCPTDGRPYWRRVFAILSLEGVTEDGISEVIGQLQEYAT